MTDILLVLTNPYAYEQALSLAVKTAHQEQADLRVVFFISYDAVGEVVDDLAERGLFGTGSLRNLQSTMLEGYRALADDVLQRVKRKAAPLEPILEGVVEQPSLDNYLYRLTEQGQSKLIVSSSHSPSSELGSFLDKVEWVREG